MNDSPDLLQVFSWFMVLYLVGVITSPMIVLIKAMFFIVVLFWGIVGIMHLIHFWRFKNET